MTLLNLTDKPKRTLMAQAYDLDDPDKFHTVFGLYHHGNFDRRYVCEFL